MIKKNALIALLFLNTIVFAQNKVGIFAGPQITSAIYTANNKKQNTEFKYGFQAGVLLKTQIEGPLFFSPACFYSLKGYNVKFTEFIAPPDVDAVNNNTSIHTFEIAPLFQFDFTNKPAHFFFKVGPSIDFQLAGKEKFSKKDGSTVNRPMKWSFSDYGRVGANAIAQFGYESAKRFFIYCHYSHGIGSINNADYGPKIQHSAFGISLGYFVKGS